MNENPKNNLDKANHQIEVLCKFINEEMKMPVNDPRLEKLRIEMENFKEMTPKIIISPFRQSREQKR